MSGNNPEILSSSQASETHFNLRCPACDKLYRIDSREIISTTPHFDCNACRGRFSFSYPPQSFYEIETKIVTKKRSAKKLAEQLEFAPQLEPQSEPIQFALRQEIEPAIMKIPSLKDCPKCHSQNALLNKECDQCGIIFDRVQDVPMDAKLGVFPSLLKAWQDLMADYENVTKHIHFVDRCEDLKALPFALKKYQALKDAQPNDALVKQMFHRVMVKSLKTKTENLTGLQKAINILSKVHWLRVIKATPLVVAVGLIIFGLSKTGMRNLVGIGAAILFLNIGLNAFIKGRISAKDLF
jgi:hypothetical protein